MFCMLYEAKLSYGLLGMGVGQALRFTVTVAEPPEPAETGAQQFCAASKP